MKFNAGNYRILLVDDDLTALELFAEIFRQ